MASKLDELMALAVIAADIRAGDTAEFYVARRPVSEHNYKEALAALQSALEALVEDAERYQWLRSMEYGKEDRPQPPNYRFWDELGDTVDEEFDYAIDAARKP